MIREGFEGGQLRFLTETDVSRIHWTALRILEEIGLRVPLPEAAGPSIAMIIVALDSDAQLSRRLELLRNRGRRGARPDSSALRASE